jgi:demethylmenaquinone methyltransferase/2-methoxy-6-polyprenyl-1,4-benzoquinol methylase
MPRYWSDERSRRVYLDGLFDETAREYDFTEKLLGFGSGPWYRREALRRAGLKPGMRVLDIATGTGLVAREAMALGGRVLGLDPSAGMLSQAQRLSYPLVRALGEKLPIADASFDFVSMGFALRHVADLEALFAEFRRVLAPGGVACILELTRPASPMAAAPLRLFMTKIVPAVAQVVRRGDDAARLMRFYWDSIDACVPPADVMRALESQGLKAKRGVSLGMFSEYVATR